MNSSTEVTDVQERTQADEPSADGVKFADLGLSPKILSAIGEMGFDKPTPIQEKSIPLVLSGRDVMGLAQTGTGKTAAFGLPLAHQLLASSERLSPRAARSLVLAPTRELANQIADNLRSYVSRCRMKVTVVVGGASINAQSNRLARGCDILVATPGRLLDLVDRGAVTLEYAQFLVLDEADQMLDLGFIHALRRIARLLSPRRQTMLFSATMPKQIEELAGAYLSDPARVQVTPPGKAADKIKQCVHYVEQSGKPALLKQLLSETPDALSLVFARTKHGAERLMKGLCAEGFRAASIHGNKSQGQRERAIQGFRRGDIRILVATDVAARGIDIPGVSHVYNYDLPEVPDSYVHRIGRTARAGAEGEGVAFCSAEEVGLLRGVERLMKISIPVASGEAPEPVRRRRSGRGGGGGGGKKWGGPNKRFGGRSEGGRPEGGRSEGGRYEGKPGGRGQNARRRRPRRESASA